MIVSCTQENLIKAISITDKIISPNTNLPILGNILLEVDNRRLKISSTNLEIGINAWIGARVEKPGSLTVPGRILINYISQLPKKRIDLMVNKNILLVECENFKASINGLSSKDFPIIPQIKEKPQIILKASLFQQALSQVISAVAPDESRPEIAGVLISLNNDFLKLVGTDSYRLAEKTLKLKTNFSDQKFILPSRIVYEIIRIMTQEKQEVKITLAENQVMFEYGWVNLISRLIQGHYPDYEQIIPAKFKSKIILNRKNFIDAVKVAGLFTSKANDIKLKIKKQASSNKTGENALVEILSESSEVGKNVSCIQGKLKGKGNLLVLNSRYLLDGLKNISSEKISLEMNDSGSPIMLRPYSSTKIGTSPDYLYLIMPVKQ